MLFGGSRYAEKWGDSLSCILIYTKQNIYYELLLRVQAKKGWGQYKPRGGGGGGNNRFVPQNISNQIRATETHSIGFNRLVDELSGELIPINGLVHAANNRSYTYLTEKYSVGPITLVIQATPRTNIVWEMWVLKRLPWRSKMIFALRS